MALSFTNEELRTEAARLGFDTSAGRQLSRSAEQAAKVSLLEANHPEEPERPPEPEPYRITTQVTQGDRVISTHTTELPGGASHG